MTNYATAILAKYGLDKDLFAVYRPFVDFTGDLTAGTMLGRLLYWHDKGEAGGGWIYKSDADWQQEIRASRHAVRKAREILEKTLGIIETRCGMARAKGSTTTFYRVKMAAFEKQFDAWLLSQALSENRQCPPIDNAEEASEPLSENGQCPPPEDGDEAGALSENGHITVRNQTGHCSIPDRSLSENGQPITGEYSGETTGSTQERGGVGTPASSSSIPPPDSLSHGEPSVLGPETTNGVTANGSPSSPSSVPPQVPPGRQHPAIVVYREIVGLKLEEWQVETIINQVGHEPESLERWRAAMQGWANNGHKRSNLQGMLDWHRDGKTGYRQNGARASPGQKRSAAARNQPTEEERREERSRSQPLR